MSFNEKTCPHVEEYDEINAFIKEERDKKQELKVKYDCIEEKILEIEMFLNQHPPSTLPQVIVEAIKNFLYEELVYEQRTLEGQIEKQEEEIIGWLEELADEKHRARVLECPCVQNF